MKNRKTKKHISFNGFLHNISTILVQQFYNRHNVKLYLSGVRLDNQ